MPKHPTIASVKFGIMKLHTGRTNDHKIATFSSRVENLMLPFVYLMTSLLCILMNEMYEHLHKIFEGDWTGTE